MGQTYSVIYDGEPNITYAPRYVILKLLISLLVLLPFLIIGFYLDYYFTDINKTVSIIGRIMYTTLPFCLIALLLTCMCRVSFDEHINRCTNREITI